MEVTTTKISGSQLQIAVQIPRSEWTEYLQNYFEKSRKNIKIDGFRAGKVPMGLVKKMYGPGIEAAAADDFVKEYYTKALDYEKIDPIAPGEIAEVDYSGEESFSFKAIVEIMPILEIDGLDRMKTYLDEIDIVDDDVEAGIASLREEHAVLHPTDDAIGENSVIVADVQGVDRTGVPLLTHKINDLTIEIGKNMFGPELDTQLSGRNIGEQVTASFKSNSDDPSAEKEIYYRFDIKDIQRKELPEIDEEFAKTINPDFDSIDKLRTGIKEYLHKQANSRAKVKMINRLVQFLIENNRIDVPPSMLSNYLEKLLENAKKENGNIEGDDFKKKYEPSAIRNLKWYILRHNLIEKHNLQASEDEINQVVEQVIVETKGDPDTLRSYFKIYKNRRQIMDDIEERKTLEFLEKTGQITARKINYRDFINEGQ